MIFKQLFDKLTCTYTYIIASRSNGEALIIDPVLNNTNIYIKTLKALNLDLIKVIDTHTHADHITAASQLKKITKCSTIMGEHTSSDIVEIKVKNNEIIKIDGLKIKTIYTPGHTSDSYSFLINNSLFSGDTLLINSTGRTDFQNGSSKDSYNSIFNILLKLPEETLLYPGHDYNGKFVSTIESEKKFNPRLQVKNLNEYSKIMNNLNLTKPKLMDYNIKRNIKLGNI